MKLTGVLRVLVMTSSRSRRSSALAQNLTRSVRRLSLTMMSRSTSER